MGSPTTPNKCPVCGAALWAPTLPSIGEKQCPRCRSDLCYLVFSVGPIFFVRKPGQSLVQLISELAAPALDLSVEELESLIRRADSLELVEIVIQIEMAINSRFDEVA